MGCPGARNPQNQKGLGRFSLVCQVSSVWGSCSSCSDRAESHSLSGSPMLLSSGWAMRAGRTELQRKDFQMGTWVHRVTLHSGAGVAGHRGTVGRTCITLSDAAHEANTEKEISKKKNKVTLALGGQYT